MRRASHFGIAALAVLLAATGGYAAYWTIVARRIEEGLAEWAQSARLRSVDVSWRSSSVGGFPASFRIDLSNFVLRDRSLTPAPELRASTLAGSARPWALDVWRLFAAQGLVADLAGAGGRPPLRLAADRAGGAMAFAARGGTLWLRLEKPKAEASGALRAAVADLWIMWPAAPPRSHTDPNFSVAADLHRVEVPATAAALGSSISELAFDTTVKGALAGGNLVQSLADWRAAGGTVEFDNFHIEWGGLAATATGTIALDRDLQPVGAFSGTIEGYGQILRALVETGHLRPGDAGLAQLVLTMLAKPGPGGRPQIATSLAIENGQVYLGPARLGAAPRLAWK
jgi:hypothetical protein